MPILRRVHASGWVDGLRDQNTVALIVARRCDRILGSAAQWMLERLLGGT
jgi:hypothetical protein